MEKRDAENAEGADWIRKHDFYDVGNCCLKMFDSKDRFSKTQKRDHEGVLKGSEQIGRAHV